MKREREKTCSRGCHVKMNDFVLAFYEISFVFRLSWLKPMILKWNILKWNCRRTMVLEYMIKAKMKGVLVTSSS